MKHDNFQQHLTTNHTQLRLEPYEKGSVKIQRRKLKENAEDTKIIRPSIRLNLKKLPKDWFTPRLSTQKSTSRQTISTDRYEDTLPSNNPQSQYSSQRLIESNEFMDELKRTSHFGQSAQSPTMKKQLAESKLSFFNDETKERKLEIQSSPHLIDDDSKQNKYIPTIKANHHTVDTWNVFAQGRTEEFDLTFSNRPQKGKSFSVKKVIKNPVPQKKQKIVSQFRIEPQKKVISRNISQKTVSVPKNRGSLSHLSRKGRLLSRQQKHKLVPFSLQNTMQMKEMKKASQTKPYFKNDYEYKASQQVFNKVNEMHLPPITRLRRYY